MYQDTIFKKFCLSNNFFFPGKIQIDRILPHRPLLLKAIRQSVIAASEIFTDNFLSIYVLKHCYHHPTVRGAVPVDLLIRTVRSPGNLTAHHNSELDGLGAPSRGQTGRDERREGSTLFWSLSFNLIFV